MDKIEVTFIKHSCFLVETDFTYYLFDYYEGELPPLKAEKPIVIFASHGHSDHFSSSVFEIPRPGQSAAFLLSEDISKEAVKGIGRYEVAFLRAGSACSRGDLKIITLPSTDLGVAFLISEKGKTFYHAGDLNCWAWKQAPREVQEGMLARYRRTVGYLSQPDPKHYNGHVDVAFVPLDPRLEENYDLGMKYFMEACDARWVFPMHMWGDYSVVRRFRENPETSRWASRLPQVTEEGQRFTVTFREE